MRQIRNLVGTIMFEDEEEIHSEIKRGEVVSLDIVGTRLPWEFSITDKKSALLL
ncbi:MAG: hypothetical protein MSA09_08685 [Lachnospiraceae bacterium]|nr:hypothetical protein [Lachnospiraceae bacterium]